MCSIGSGESYKIVLKRPLVHYIWWGNLKAGIGKGDEYLANAVTTPNIMAGIKTIKVIYWRQSGSNDLRKQLDSNIVQKSVKKISEILTDKEGYSMPAFMGQGIIMDNIVRTLNKYHAYSAVKDFLSLCVLYRYGGYYFDTTTALLENDPKDIPGKLIMYDIPKIVFTMTRGTFSFYLNDRSVDATIAAQMVPDTIEGVVTSKGFDVWAMYAPPKHQAVLTMIDSYIERCENFGLDEHPSRKQCLGKTVHEQMTRDDRDVRNKIIGNLIITSVQEGLYKHIQYYNKLKPGNNLKLDDYGWLTTDPSTTTESKYHVSAECAILGIGKRHAGQWRKV